MLMRHYISGTWVLMRWLVGLEDAIGLCGDQCISKIPPTKRMKRLKRCRIKCCWKVEIQWLFIILHIIPPPCYWHLVVITGDLFKIVQVGYHAPPHPAPRNNIWRWPLRLKHVRFPSEWYASYWNAFLLILVYFQCHTDLHSGSFAFAQEVWPPSQHCLKLFPSHDNSVSEQWEVIWRSC